VRVTGVVDDLAADVVLPMTAPMSIDESALEGGFTFDLDRRGRVASMSSPRASELGGQVFTAPLVAHALFPRLPDRVVVTGDTWSDAVTYTETVEAGMTSVVSTLNYTVVGTTQREGRSLTEIGFEGSAEVNQELSLEGASVTQASRLQVQGHALWDVAAGLLYESDMAMEGPGTVRVALLPAALPTRVRWQARVRLQGR
jgi:hypothetical protein